MDTPQPATSVLESVKPVDVEVVADDEQRELCGKRPRADETVVRRPSRVIDPTNQVADHEPEHEALDQRVADQIEREPVAKQPLAVVRPDPLGNDDRDGAADDDRRCEKLPAHDAADITRRSFLRTASSLS